MKREMNMVQIKIDKTKYTNELHSLRLEKE